jgi:hypothetical protein
MDSFTEIEQEVSDLDWYAVDEKGRIGHFATGGGILLPIRISESKTILEKLNSYFNQLPALQKDGFIICPEVKSRLDNRMVPNFFRYVESFAQMSAKGLYSYDNPPHLRERQYLRVTLPKVALRLNDLPEDVKTILQGLKLTDIDYSSDSVITKQIADAL